MKLEEFLEFLSTLTKQTKRIKIVEKAWNSGVKHVEDDFINKNLGKIISFLEENINKFCKNDEFLSIYNFQYAGEMRYCELAILIKPMQEFNKPEQTLKGEPLSLLVDTETKEIVTAEYALNKQEKDKLVDVELAGNYGSFLYQKSPCCFVAIKSLKNISATDLKDANMDKSFPVKTAPVFDSIIEARAYLDANSRTGGHSYIVTVACDKKDYPNVRETGISNKLVDIKVIIQEQLETDLPPVKRRKLNEELEVKSANIEKNQNTEKESKTSDRCNCM